MVDCPSGEMVDGQCQTCGGIGEHKQVPSAEEWAIHDHEGFYGLVGEYTSFAYVAQAAEMIAEHGEAYAKYAENCGGNDLPDADDFNDHYRGEWDSLEAYAEDFVESCGIFESMPESLRGYFDMEAYARDMDVYTERLSNGSLAVFTH
jgi:antirestriction protein